MRELDRLHIAEAALATLGLATATYLTLCQLRLIATPWEPLFSSSDPAFINGSDHVLHSHLSQLLPVPDASLGAAAYLAKLVLVLLCLRVASPARRSRSWLTLASSVLSVLLFLAALTLTALQAFYLHAYCTLCLASAVVSVMLLPLSLSVRGRLRIKGRF